MKAITNGKLILPDERGEFQIVEHQALLYDTEIREIVPEMGIRSDIRPEVEEIIDARGAYVSPGFVNIHLHGCVGCDAMDDEPTSLPSMALYQASTGVTAMLPTTMTYDFPTIYAALDHIRGAMAAPGRISSTVASGKSWRLHSAPSLKWVTITSLHPASSSG